MNARSRSLLSGAAILSLSLVAPLGCARTQPDTVPPGAERGGAGADGNNSAPGSLSNGGADPETTPMTEPSTNPPETAPGTTPPDPTTTPAETLTPPK